MRAASREGLPPCTDNHRAERSHRLRRSKTMGVQVRDDLREHRKLVEREIDTIGVDLFDGWRIDSRRCAIFRTRGVR